MSTVLSHDEAFCSMPWFCQRFHMVQRFGAPFCSPTLPRDIKKMADVQIAFFRQLCRLKRSVTPAVHFPGVV